MSYTVLARKYRSATFDEIVGQDHVAQTLKKAIESGRVAHAFLFCGTRGTGKTSMARILAKSLNCHKADGPTTKPCLKCNSCEAIARGEDIDVIEIDAASNTQVEKTREIIDNAQYRPAASRFKIYIIDEVHMLSKSSFNALLKTLEEPPEHVKFILATTEPEKVLPTILSRCQRYDFRNIPTREIAAHLKEICKQEKIKADEDALLLIAKAGAGSMRDALSLLDRMLSIGEKQLTIETIEQLLGMPRSQLIFDLAGRIGEGDVKAVLEQTEKLIASGFSPDTLVAALTDHLRNLLILSACGLDSSLVEVPGLPAKDLQAQAGQFDAVTLTQNIALLEELRRHLRQTQAGRALIDATLVRLALAKQFASISELLERVDNGKPGPALAAHPAPVRSSPAAVQKKKLEPVAEGSGFRVQGSVIPEPIQMGTSVQEQASSSNVEPVDPSNLPGVWQALLDQLKRHGLSLHAAVSQGRFAGVQDGVAVVRYGPEHQTFVKRLESNGKKELIRDAFSKVLNESVGIKFEVDPASAEVAVAEKPDSKAQPGQPLQREIAEPAAEPAPAAVRLTPELLQSLRNDPWVKAVLDTLGGDIIKVE